MTQPDQDPRQQFSLQSVEDVGTGVAEIQKDAKRLGLTWSMRPGTVTSSDKVILDGDTEPIPATYLIGTQLPDERVMVMTVPPNSNYVVGLLTVGWRDFSPKVYTSGGGTDVSSTTLYARYRRSGTVIRATAAVTFNATTSGGAAIDLPVPAAFRNLNCGTCALFGTATPSTQTGIAIMTGSLDKLVITSFTGGFLDATSGQNIRYSVCYEAK